ncbi:MAG: flagellar biosynthesis protein FlgC [Desulfobulbaceae bacterium]|uniref:Flagellar biosynthesis protein FlgC n=1 Tax=Candidatus Desulfobia pelagia TaxID=2841692 RepID=A0A8J6TC30_9BACT|nr:flagellar biosynthesis protein FlgC [Candidatus Desulfobia pelagia]
MSSGINSTLSALQGFQKKQESIANNVANVETDGYKKTRVTFYEGENSTVTPHVKKIETPGPQVYEQTAEGSQLVEKSNVDLVEEIPQAMINKRNFQANIKMLQVEDEMKGYLLDMMG